MTHLKKKSITKKETGTIYIYWCYDEMPEKYMFIFSQSSQEAKKKFQSRLRSNGINMVIEELNAKKICVIPSTLIESLKINRKSGVASDELLQKAGIEFITSDKTAFRYNGRIFREKFFYLNFLGNENSSHPSLYLFKVKNRLCYKIGITNNIPRRLKELTGSEPLEYVSHIQTPLSQEIELSTLRMFKKFSIGKEFVEVDTWGSDLINITFKLYWLEFSRCTNEHIRSTFFENAIEQLTQLVNKHNLNTSPLKDDIKIGSDLLIKIKDLSIKKRDNILRKL